MRAGRVALVVAVLAPCLGGCAADRGGESVGTESLEVDVEGQQKLTASDAGAFDRFGNAVAISGGIAVVGSADDDAGQGSAYVFVRGGTGWDLEQKLVAPTRRAGAGFGSAVALSGGTAVIGAPGEDVGAVDHGLAYVFSRSGTHWTAVQTLFDADASPGSDRLGSAVAVGSNVLAVGGQRSVRLFTRGGSVWNEVQTLSAPSGASAFGLSLALSDGTLVVGTKEDSVSVGPGAVGSVRVYALQGGVWTFQQRLATGVGGHDLDGFGASLALDGDTALIGASDALLGGSGSAYVFTRSGSVWTQTQTLSAPDPVRSDEFGRAVALTGDVALIGAPKHTHAGGADEQGTAYLFTRSSGQWTESTELRADDGNGHDHLGFALALGGNTALIGSPNDDYPFQAQGSAYAFTLLGIAAGCAHVAPDGDDTMAAASNGATPFATVQAAIYFAYAHPSVAASVCVAAGPVCGASHDYWEGGAYTDLSMVNGISVFGRYESTGWTRCEDSITRLPSRTRRGLSFGSDITAETELNGFDVVGSPYYLDTTAVTVASPGHVKLVDLSVSELPLPSGATRPFTSIGIRIEAGSDVAIQFGRISPIPAQYFTTGVSVSASRLSIEQSTILTHGASATSVDQSASTVSISESTISAHGTAVFATAINGNAGDSFSMHDSVIEAFAPAGWGTGLSLSSFASTGVEVAANQVHVEGQRGLVGLSLFGGGAVIESNDVELVGTGVGSATGIACADEANAPCLEVVGNRVSGPTCSGSCAFTSVALQVAGAGTLVDSNFAQGGCSTNAGSAVAIGLQASGNVRIQNNVLIGATCGTVDGVAGYGVLIDAADGDNVDLHSNFIDGGSAGNSLSNYTAGIEIESGHPSVRNNILRPGTYQFSFNVDQAQPGATPAVFEHNAFGPGSSSTVLYRILGAPDAYTIQAVNAAPNSSANFLADCGFPLAAGAACIDAGTASGAPQQDIDGDLRDAMPDVGPDEFIGARHLQFIGVTEGRQHTCGVLRDGTLRCWGRSEFFWGNDPPVGETFRTVAAGFQHLCAIRTDKTLKCWGSLGYAGNYELLSSVPGGTFDAIAANYQHDCGIRTDGTITCWGWNGAGQLDAPSGTFTAIGVGATHSCALRSDGAVLCWGSNDYGEATPPGGPFVALSARSQQGCAVRPSGAIECWGRGPDLQGWTPPPPGDFVSVQCGDANYSCGLHPNGEITCWGENTLGQVSPPQGPFTTFSSGFAHSCAIRPSGQLACWGENDVGQATPPLE